MTKPTPDLADEMAAQLPVTFRIPLPPNGSNHATQVGANGHVYKVAAQRAWEQGVALLVGGWTPPARTPLEDSGHHLH